MTMLPSTFAVVAEDQYRRERATREFHTAGRAHHARFGTWRDRRRAPRSAAR